MQKLTEFSNSRARKICLIRDLVNHRIILLRINLQWTLLVFDVVPNTHRVHASTKTQLVTDVDRRAIFDQYASNLKPSQVVINRK